MAEPDAKHLKYQPHVDGLRALAVLPVIFFHAGVGFPGGFVGVDIFFVISGYLITGLLLKELDADQFSIFEFWERRVRRILPALGVVVLATLIGGWLLYFPADFKELGQSMIAQALLVSNVFFYANASYFGAGVEIKPLLHTWSLAVEEQFYLFFPFLLLVVTRFARKSLVPVIIAVCAFSFALSVYCSYTHERANFYLLPTRAWELAIGSLLAAIASRRPKPGLVTEATSWGGLIAICCALFLYDRDTRFPGLTASLPCIGAALIIWSNGGGLTVVGRILATRPLVFIGLISYSLYLWHWPVLVFARYWAVGPISLMWRLALLLGAIVLAALSWKFVETPVRKRVIFKPRWQVFAFGGTTTLIFALAGLMVYRLQGVPSRIPSAALQYLVDNKSVQGSSNPASSRQVTLKDAMNRDFNQLGSTNTNLPIGLLVWGDSHAEVETPVLDALGKEHSIRAVGAAHSQTAPLVGYESHGIWSLGNDSVAFNNTVVDFVRKEHVPDVLIIARWDYYIDADKGTARLHGGLVNTINALQNSGTHVWIMRQVPRYPWDVPKALATAVLHGHDPEALGLSPAELHTEIQAQDPIFDGIAGKYSGVTILDPTALFVDASGQCRVTKDGKSLYLDTDHVSTLGSLELRPLFEPIFESTAPSPVSAKPLTQR